MNSLSLGLRPLFPCRKMAEKKLVKAERSRELTEMWGMGISDR